MNPVFKLGSIFIGIYLLTISILSILFFNPLNMIFYSATILYFAVCTVFIVRFTAKNKKEIQEKNKLIIKEMNHRIKNNIGILTNIIDLKKFVYHDSESKQLLSDLRDKTILISKIHESIYESADVFEINLGDYIKDILSQTNSFYDSEVAIKYDVDEIIIKPKHAIDIVLFIQELFTNSIKYAYNNVDNKEFFVEIHRNKELVEIKISDNGCGFDKSKLGKSETFGLKMIETIVKQYNGNLKFENEGGMASYLSLEI